MRISKEIIRAISGGERVCVVGPGKGPWAYEIARDVKRFFKTRISFVLLS